MKRIPGTEVTHGATWTAADIGDLTGRTALVTGANSGIGYETVRALSGHGAHVVMACRNQEKARKARDRLEGELDAVVPRAPSPRSVRPGLGPARRRRLPGGARPPGRPGQQRGRDGHAVPPDPRRLRAADGHQPPGSLRVHGPPARSHRDDRALTRRDGQLAPAPPGPPQDRRRRRTRRPATPG